MDFNRFKGRRNGVQVITYETDAEELKLIPLGDVHLGAKTCEVAHFLGTVEYIKESGSKVILMGDLAECASRHSVGSGWVDQTMTPQDQQDALEEILKPIAPQILGLIQGNHEYRIWKQTGLNFSKTLAKLIGVPYVGYSFFLKLKVRKFNYIVHAQHGSSNAWYPHTKLTAAMRTAQHTDSDLYLYGHTHELLSLKVPRRTFDLRSRTVKRDKKYFCLTGSFLGYSGSYAEMKNMYPTQTGVAKIKLFGDRWDIHITT